MPRCIAVIVLDCALIVALHAFIIALHALIIPVVIIEYALALTVQATHRLGFYILEESGTSGNECG